METADLWLGIAWKVASIASIIGTLVVAVLVLRMKAEFASATAHGALALVVDGHDTRLTKIEALLLQTPSREDLQKILTLLERVSGESRVLAEKIGRVADAEERTEERLGRIEEYMLKVKL